MHVFFPQILAYLQETNGAVVKALRRVVEDAFQGTLDNAACSQYPLAEFHQTLTDLQRRYTTYVSQVIYCNPLSIKSTNQEAPHTSDPNISFLSWISIHPNLQPGTSQRFAKPPQERIGTSLLREAKDGQLHPGKTWEDSSRRKIKKEKLSMTQPLYWLFDAKAMKK